MSVEIHQCMRQTRSVFRLFRLFCALFFSLAFSFAISMTFPVFGAPRRPVNRLYFFYDGLNSNGGGEGAQAPCPPHEALPLLAVLGRRMLRLPARGRPVITSHP